MIGFKALHLLLLCQVIQQITAATTQNPPDTKECPMIKCIPECFKGVDSDGCNICNCDNTCVVTECPEGQICVMNQEQPECVPNDEPKTCPSKIVCKTPCEADIGEDGCYSKCSCPLTCNDIKCKPDEECEIVKKVCIRAPCFPDPTCFPKNRTCGQSPNVNRCLNETQFFIRWSYSSSTKSCEWFRYYGCSPSPNTFNNRRQCMDTCVQVRSSCPPNTGTCKANCYWGEKTPGECPECLCPCQTMRCETGYECRLQEEDCSKIKPCHPTPYCDPVSSTMCEPVCNVECEYGHVIDENGCQTCPCNSAPANSADVPGLI